MSNPYRPWQRGWLPNETLRRAITQASHFARGALLDLGSGRQPYRDLFLPRVISYTALDYPSPQYAYPLTTCYGDALKLPFCDCSFNTIVSFEVLEHLPEPATFFAEVARVLQPGGHLLLTTPHIWGLHDEPADFYRFTPYGLSYLCHTQHLSPLMIEPVAGYWATTGARFSYYLARFRRLRQRRVLHSVLQYGVQRVALSLDRLDFVRTDAWNHMLVARREAV